VARRWERRALVYVNDLTEDANDVTPTFERDCAQFRIDPLAFCIQEDAAVVRSFRRAEQIAHEDLLASLFLLRREHRGQVAPANIADNALRGRVHPTDDPEPIDHVRWNAATLKRALHISSECL
jgi:hypothetical protein